jgi:hypothetical protein
VLGAFLCNQCHVAGDTDWRNDYDWWELAVHRSITWSVENGWVLVCPGPMIHV